MDRRHQFGHAGDGGGQESALLGLGLLGALEGGVGALQLGFEADHAGAQLVDQRVISPGSRPSPRPSPRRHPAEVPLSARRIADERAGRRGVARRNGAAWLKEGRARLAQMGEGAGRGGPTWE
jgi:hypothetical protein